MREHGGDIEVQSELGYGNAFRANFPGQPAPGDPVRHS